ncbi:MAG: hypothetical protein J6P54_07940, partial [Bacteroidales bacterium]|nr:hypothetical protein [Bacteroidales bacterium]
SRSAGWKSPRMKYVNCKTIVNHHEQPKSANHTTPAKRHDFRFKKKSFKSYCAYPKKVYFCRVFLRHQTWRL